MELGAIVCLPNQPLCSQCPAESLCEARRLGIHNDIPAIRIKQPVTHISIAVLVLEQKGKTLLTSRHKLHIIPGKWGFPCRKILKGESSEDVAARLCREILGREIPLESAPKISHSITHHRLTAHGFFGKSGKLIEQLRRMRNFRLMDLHQDRELLTSSLFRKVLQKFPGIAGKM